MTSPRAPVLVVSKPLGPPWTDGSKNLARDIVTGLRDHTSRELHAFAPHGASIDGVTLHRVPTATLSRRTSLAMLGRLAVDRETALWHFVFAPSSRTKRAAGALASLRRRPTVQTIASAPSIDVRLGDVVFADRVVALSRGTLARALDEGVAASRLSHVSIAITPPTPPSARALADVVRAHGLAGRFVVTFPGDLEHGRGAEVLLEACAAMKTRKDVVLVLACRDKTERARSIRAELASRAVGRGLDVRMIGQTAAILALLAASDVVALPTDSLFAKVDHPLVLIEAMHLGRPVLVSEGTTAHELADEGGALGAALDPDAIAAVLDRLVTDSDARHDAGARAKAHASARTLRAMALAYDSIYDECLR